MKRLFFGGIHPRYNKEMSLTSDNLTTVTPNQVVIPLKQHIGDVCQPLVKVGDHVLKGQKIGDGEGMCVPVHASVSGTVSAIEPRIHPNGQTIDAIVIDNDFKNETVEFTECDTPLEDLDLDTLVHTIRESGIIGMGGAAFPSNIKALTSMGNVDTLIANACECEPYITADDMLLRTDPEPVIQGVLILQRLLSPQRTVIAIEDNKKTAIKILKAFAKKNPSIEIAVLPTRYPQGSEKQLIQAITGKQVPPGKLPIDVQCVVFNVSTFAAIHNAVRLGKPITERIVTVTGEGVRDPQNFIVPIGTSFDDLINAAGGLTDDVERVLNGGPMMGIAQADLSAPVVKATNAILCLKKDPNFKVENSVCIRCGKCSDACPMRLKPLYIARYVNAGNIAEVKRLNVTDCMECGICSYTCPAKLPLTDKCREGKEMIKEEDEK